MGQKIFEENYAHLPIVTFSVRNEEYIPGRLYVSDEDESGFTINHTAGSTTGFDIELNWIAVGVEEAIVTISNGTTENISVTVVSNVAAQEAVAEEPAVEETVEEAAEEVIEEIVAEEPVVEEVVEETPVVQEAPAEEL